MSKYRTIALCLLVLFSYQLVPVTVVGSFLYSNQLMEELPHGASGSVNNSHSPAENIWGEEIWSGFGKHFPVTSSQDNSGLEGDSFIHTRSADDIQTPPPNC